MFVSMSRVSKPARKPLIGARVHYIPEWCEHRGMRQVDLVKALEGHVDKSTVSRWFSGVKPHKKHLEILRQALQLDEAAAIFRHPDDDWLAKLFRGKSEDEKYKLRQLIEAALNLHQRAS